MSDASNLDEIIELLEFNSTILNLNK